LALLSCALPLSGGQEQLAIVEPSEVADVTEITEPSEKHEVPNEVPVAPDSTEVAGEVPVALDSTEGPGEVPVAPDSTEVPGEVPVALDSTEVPGEVPVALDSTEVPDEVPAALDSTEVPGEVPVAPDNTEVPGGEAPQDIEYLRSRWREFIESLRGEGSSGNLDAFLRSACDPIGLEDDTLVLGFYYSFHKEKIEDTKYRHLVEKKLKEIFGRPYKIRCILVDYKREVPPQARTQNPVVKAALEMGARISEEDL
jgi:hypothetical protein